MTNSNYTVTTMATNNSVQISIFNNKAYDFISAEMTIEEAKALLEDLQNSIELAEYLA